MASAASAPDSQRIDQWLLFARIAKSRTLAQMLVVRGKVRINRARIDKASHLVKPGDVLTMTLGPRVRILEVCSCGLRRGPAIEAAGLYQELTPRNEATKSQVSDAEAAVGEDLRRQGLRAPGSGRPTKRDRRAIERLKGS